MKVPMIAHMSDLELNLLKRYPGKTNRRVRKIAQREIDRRERHAMLTKTHPQYYHMP